MLTYYPVPLHMHSVWERNASMEGHFYNAKKLGIHHMYLTDHDVRMGRRFNHVDSFDFTKGVLRVEEPSPDPRRPRWYGFTVVQEDEGTLCEIKDNALFLVSTSKDETWSTVRATFDTSQKRHEWALLANVFLHLGMAVSSMDADTRVVIDVELSQRPPEFLHGHILYVFGNCDGLSSPYHAVHALDGTSDFVKYDFPLLRDAEAVGGGDNVLRTVSFSVSARCGKTASLSVNHLSFTWDLAFEEGRREQQRLATEIGKKYEVTPFVTSEITAAGPHKICFSTKVPIIDYEARNYKVSDEEAMEHVRAYGGIYARNHPFERIKDKLLVPNLTDAEKEAIIEEQLAYVVENRAWNAAMIEVGFPEGREAVPFAAHLKLWDTLSKNGVFISGYGDSDNHNNNINWFDGNNFVAYIAAEEPTEDNFIAAMRAGNLYTGDPVYLQKMDVKFTGTLGQNMGQITTNTPAGKARLTLSGVPEGCRVVWVANGEKVKTEEAAGTYEGSLPIPTESDVNFVRAELWRGDRCILLTNPIYHTENAEIGKSIPVERRFSHV